MNKRFLITVTALLLTLSSQAQAFAQWMNAADVDFVITHPEGYELDPKFVGNQQFVILPDAVVEKLSKTIEFTHWGQAPGHRTICRFVTSWATTEEELDVLEKTLNDAH